MTPRTGSHIPAQLRAPAAVLDLELGAEGVPPALEAGRGAYILVHILGLPVAELWCAPGNAARDRTSLADAALDGHGGRVVRRLLARRLERRVERLPITAADLLDAPSDLPSEAPSITVAVCTRERPTMLERCLAGLRASEHAPTELLVVDSAPAGDATERIARAAGARYEREERAGLDVARQRAVAATRTEIIAFTDDDAVPDPGWTAAIARAFADNPEFGGVTGLVAPLMLETEAQLAFEAYGGFRRGLDRWIARAPNARRPIAFRFGNIGRVGTGANMAFRRSALVRAGPFDPALDVGSPVGGAGDLEMLFRLIKMGESVAYDPSAIVRHEHRRTHEELVAQIESWGRGFAGFAEAASRRFPEERPGFAALTLWLLAAWHSRRLLAPRLGERFPRRLVLAEIRGLARGRAEYSRAGDAYRVRRDAPTPVGRGVVANRVVDLASPRMPLTGLPERAPVRLEVRHGTRHLGTVTLPGAGPTVGAARVADAIAGELGASVLVRRSGGERALLHELATALEQVRAAAAPRRRAGAAR